MTDPCKQAENIDTLRAEISRMFVEIREDQKKQLEILSGLARQDERIKAIEYRETQFQKALDVLFERIRQADLVRPEQIKEIDQHVREQIKEIDHRVRDLENAPAKNASKFWWLVCGALIGMGTSVAASIIVKNIG